MPGPGVFDFLIVGGGLAAAAAVDGIREVDPTSTIGLLTEESEPPYQRPPLSKEFLQYADVPRSLLHVKPEGWFEEQERVELITRQKALVLDPAAMSVTTARGNVFRASRILIATGGRPRRIELPGHDLDGVFTLRTVDDSEAIRDAAIAASRAVLIGAGFVGMELAASLTAHEVTSTVIETRDRVWARILPPELSGWMRVLYEGKGVSFRLGSAVDRFVGQGSVEAVEVGSESLPCDMVVVGVGMTPCDGIAGDAGLAAADGILVDTFGETSHPHIYAAGDVARFPDPVFGGNTRVEHWEHAREHGRLVGRNMAGEKEPYERLSHFFSRVFDLSLDAVGRPAEADETVVWGVPGDGPCAAFGLSEGRLCAVVLLDAPEELEAGRALVRERASAKLLYDVTRRDEVSLRDLARLATEYRDRDPGTGDTNE
ncbi:MAG: FAD-dependent oxidoreductase [marine benthic group bacterium]|nr:FAD-dependent oxidoreductase [Gemmatimonadota bacterium]